MITDVCITAVVSGLLAGAIAFTWRLGRGTAQDPKMLLLSSLMRHGTRWHGHGHLR
jgi:hypothetical protein